MSNDLRHWMTLIESSQLDHRTMEQAVEILMELISNSNSGTGYIAFDMGCRDDPYGETDKECWDRAFPLWCEDAIMTAYRRITGLFKNGKLPIWRVITAPANWQPKPGDHPGRYWSYEPNAAEAHWGTYDGDHVEWMLAANVDHNQIDWANTLAQNAMPDYEEEKEVSVSNDLFPFTYKRK